MPKIVDEFGIEIDEETRQALEDPKSGTLKKILEYFDKRKDAEKAKAAADELKIKKTEKPFWQF